MLIFDKTFTKSPEMMTEENQNEELTEDEKMLFAEILSEDSQELSDLGEARRHFIKQLTLAGGGLLAFQLLGGQELFASPGNEALTAANLENAVNLSFKVNGVKKTLAVDSRMTLLDTLRERLELTGSKKDATTGNAVPVRYW